MAENSKIEWTHHTFNPWIGCQKVGPGCDHCYAEAMMDTRLGRVQWGPHAARSRTSAAYWLKPLAWNAAAKAAGQRHRVFCASLADVFDNHESIEDEWRHDLWHLIHATPHLDWMLLTKRPGNILRYLPNYGDVQPNLWLGCTVVNQAEADRDIPKLLAVPAKVRFLSMEPLLGPVTLNYLQPGDPPVEIDALSGTHGVLRPHRGTNAKIDLVIVGGESGPGARPMHPDWVRDIRDQCVSAGTAFFFKQWGEFRPPITEDDHRAVRDGKAFGGSILPNGNFGNPYGSAVVRVGKKAAGRLLDGRTWDQMPADTPIQEPSK